MKKFTRAYLPLVLFAGLIIVLDQWTKSYVRDSMTLGSWWAPWDWLLPYARIVHWYNTGVAFGLLQNFGGVHTVVAIVVTSAILYYYPRVSEDDWSLRLAMGMQLGGAIGNLIDRLMRGQVTDFISIGNFPVFNIADASISIGVAILIVGIWVQDRREKQAAKQSSFVGTLPQQPENELRR